MYVWGTYCKSFNSLAFKIRMELSCLQYVTYVVLHTKKREFCLSPSHGLFYVRKPFVLLFQYSSFGGTYISLFRIFDISQKCRSLSVSSKQKYWLKGQCHEIFWFWFFSWISIPFKTVSVSLTPVANLPPVSLTPVVHLDLRISPRMFEKNRNDPIVEDT